MSCLHPPCQVSIRGKMFGSIQEAARVIGVRASGICKALDTHGHADFVGLGYRKGIRKGNRNAKRIPVTIGKVTFESRAECAKAIGWHRSRVSFALGKKASDAQRSALIAAVMQFAAKREGNQPRAWRKEAVITRPIGRASQYDADEINALLDEGGSIRAVSAATGASENTVRRIRASAMEQAA